ncbi:MAG: stage II sporulation protein D [Bacillota bacterium]
MKKTLLLFLLLITAAAVGIPSAVGLMRPAGIKEIGTVVHLYSHETGNIIDLPVEDYVAGVVAAEMPAEFPVEALKAQAVAARTYIMKRQSGGGVLNPVHPGADVCDDPTHYQAWISREEMKKKWGAIKYYQYYLKILTAVHSTAGEVITYNGQLIDPVYHSSCGGRGTVDSGDVWRFQEPYLKGVPCPYDADQEPVTVTTFTPEEFKKATGEDVAAEVSTGGANFFEVVEKTSGDFPKTVRIGKNEFSSTAVREMLGLRSARFDISVEQGVVKVTTVGKGHGVGMCQYGACGMARQGKNYREILKHYYTGVDIVTMK